MRPNCTIDIDFEPGHRMTTLHDAQQAGIAPWDNQIKDRPLVAVYLDRYPCTSCSSLSKLIKK